MAPTDWMAARWIDLGYATPIDKKNVPNEKNLQDSLKHPPFDKNRDFTLPWQSGITGIGYNPKKTGRKLTSVNDLFDPKFKGRVSMFSEWRDSAGLVLLGLLTVIVLGTIALVVLAWRVIRGWYRLSQGKAP